MSKNFKVKNGLEVTNNITASGDISASGTIIAEQITSTDDITAIGTIQGEQITSTDDMSVNDDLTVGGQINVAADIVHTLDADTKISFAVDKITLAAGGVDMITLTEDTNDTIEFGAPITSNITASGNISASGFVSASSFSGDGAGLTNVSSTVDIDSLDALGGTGLHQTQDKFMFSDNGTEKSITFSNLEDAIFGNVSGDATIAAGGALTIAADSVQGTMLNDDVADDSTIEISSNNLSVLKVPNALTAGAGITSAGTFDGAAARTFNIDSASMGGFYSGSMNSFTTTGTGSFGYLTAAEISSSGILKAATLDAAAVTDTLAAAIVSEIDNDEIPIAKLAEDAITIAGTSTALGGSITADTIAGQISADTISGNQINGGTIGSVTISALAGALSLGDNNITNVGDINCDSISIDAAGTGLDIVFGGNTTKNKITLTDNLADALNITEGSNSYIKFTTSNNDEEILFSENARFTNAITASGDISASGTITAATLDAAAVSDGLAAAIVSEIDNDEIPIAKLAEDAITIGGAGSTALGGTATAANILKGSTAVSSSAQIDSLINDTIAATIVGEIDNDEIPIAKLAEDAITIAGTSTALGGSITADTIAGQISADTISGNQINGGTIGSVTISALAGALSLGDNNITNVGDINADSISVDAAGTGLNVDFSGGNTTKNLITLQDDLADALNITEGSNSYIKFTTTNSSEKILFSKNSEFLGNVSGSATSTGSFGRLEGDGAGLTNVTSTVDIDSLDALGGTGIAQSDKLIFSDAGTEKSITFSNLEDAIFGNVSGDATVAAGGALTIAGTSVENSMLVNDGITIAGTDTSLGGSITADTIAGQISADTISGNQINGGTIGSVTISALAGALSLGDNNITNVGDINADSISIDAAGTGLNIDFSGGNTTKNKITLKDNLADALNITEGSNSYIKFTTTNNDEEILFSENTRFTNAITASGNISSSGNILGDKVYVDNNLAISYNSGYRFAYANNTPIQFGKTANPIHLIGSVTASGNISSSGTITAEQITSADDMTVTDDLNVGGDITVGQSIFHDSDTDTKMVFTSDVITFTAGNEQLLQLSEGGQDQVIIGDGGDVDFHVKGGGSNTLFVQGSSQNVGIGTNVPTEKLQVAGNISASGNYIGDRRFNKTSNTDAEAQGDIVFLGGTTSMDAGKIYHYKSDGTWELADADAAANCDGLLAVALGAASDTNGMLLRGTVTLDHDPGAVGDVLFLATGGTGQATATAPSGNTDIVRVVGYCLDASNGQIWFNPDNTFVEVSA